MLVCTVNLQPHRETATLNSKQIHIFILPHNIFLPQLQASKSSSKKLKRKVLLYISNICLEPVQFGPFIPIGSQSQDDWILLLCLQPLKPSTPTLRGVLNNTVWKVIRRQFQYIIRSNVKITISIASICPLIALYLLRPQKIKMLDSFSFVPAYLWRFA